MAITATKLFETVVGNKVMGAQKLYGDGSTTTWDVPLETIDSAWFQRIDDTETSELISWSGNTVTFGAAIASTKYGVINYIGV